jgi:hypothetical protein
MNDIDVEVTRSGIGHKQIPNFVRQMPTFRRVTMNPRFLTFVVFVSYLLFSREALTAPLSEPSGTVLLTLTGAITNTNSPGKAEFDRTMLESIGLTELVTSTPYTDGRPTFRGVTVAKLLDAAGAAGLKLHVAAVNGYQVVLDADEMRRYPILIALEQDGKPLRLRDRGPLWVILPSDQHPELKADSHNFKSIWQVKSIDIQ